MPLNESLTRLHTLAELREYDLMATPADAQRYNGARLEEAQHLAQVVHRELRVVLAEVSENGNTRTK